LTGYTQSIPSLIMRDRFLTNLVKLALISKKLNESAMHSQEAVNGISRDSQSETLVGWEPFAPIPFLNLNIDSGEDPIERSNLSFIITLWHFAHARSLKGQAVIIFGPRSNWESLARNEQRNSRSKSKRKQIEQQ
jgi:hypothetical protein